MLSDGQKRPFLMPFGIALEGQRFGSVVDKFSESYTFQRVEGYALNYASRIFASRERIFPLFTALCALVSKPCDLLLVDYTTPDLDSYVTDVMAKEEILDSLSRRSFQLVNDGFTQFIIESEDFEVEVGQHKEMVIFAESLTQVLEVLKDYGIPKEPKRTLFENAPHDHVPISKLFEDKETRKNCEPLPREEVEKYEADPKAYKGFIQEIIRELRMKVYDETGGGAEDPRPESLMPPTAFQYRLPWTKLT